MTADADLSFSRATFSDIDPIGDHIPGALARVISGGVTFEAKRPLYGSVRTRHFGPRPLVEDASVQSKSTTLWNGEAGYRLSKQARISVELFNLFNARVSDIDYFYASRLPGEASEGVEDIHTHPALPRSARVALRVSF
jgi:hypothetical protein